MDSDVSQSDFVRKRKRRIQWCTEDEVQLVQIWEIYRTELEAKRNSHVYEIICAEMGGKYNKYEIHTKVRNMTQIYRRETRKMKKEGCPSKWIHYDSIHKIVGGSSDGNNSVVESFSCDESSTSSSLKKCDPLSSAEPTSSFSFPRIMKVGSLLSPEHDTPLNSTNRKVDFDSEILHNMIKQTEQGTEQLKILKNVAHNTQNLCEQFGNFLQQQQENDKIFMEYFKKLVEKD